MSLPDRLMEQISNGLRDDDAAHRFVATVGLFIATEVKEFKELVASQSHQLEQLNEGVKTLQEKTNALEKKLAGLQRSERQSPSTGYFVKTSNFDHAKKRKALFTEKNHRKQLKLFSKHATPSGNGSFKKTPSSFEKPQYRFTEPSPKPKAQRNPQTTSQSINLNIEQIGLLGPSPQQFLLEKVAESSKKKLVGLKPYQCKRCNRRYTNYFGGIIKHLVETHGCSNDDQEKLEDNVIHLLE